MKREVEFKEVVMKYIEKIIEDKHTEKSPAMIVAIAELVKSLNQF